MKKAKRIGLILILIMAIGGIIGTIYLAYKDTSRMIIGPFSNTLSTKYLLMIVIFISIMSLDLLYLLLGSKFYRDKDKLIIYILGNILLISNLTGIIIITYNRVNTRNREFMIDSNTKEEIELDTSVVVSSNYVNLSDYDSDVTIKEGGTYYISGNLSNSLIINTTDEVELVLDNVNISSSKTAALIGLNTSKILINLKEGSINTLSDGGNSSYDGCIYSNGELIFTGTGKLIVYGNQNEGEGIATEAQDITFNGGIYEISSNDDGINAGGDGATIVINDGTFYINASGDGIDSNKNAIINGGEIFVMGSDVGGDSGIDTDDGYTVNGGLVVALGTDMIETPLDDSNAKTLAFTLDKTISKNVMISIFKDDKLFLSFVAPKSFKTIIVSGDKVTNGNYKVYYSNKTSDSYGISYSKYTKDNLLSVNGSNEFIVNKTINYYSSK